MKKMFFSLFVLFSVSSFAGEIISKSGSLISLDFDPDTRTVDMILMSGSRSTSRKFTIEQFEALNQAGAKYVKTTAFLYIGGSSANRQHLFRNSEEMFKDAKENFNHVWAGYLIPIYNLFLIQANIQDIIALPVNITWKAVRNKWAKKDLEVINHALNTNMNQEISDIQFHRLFFYL